MGNDGINIGKEFATVFINAVKCACFNQLFKLAAVNLFSVNAVDKVRNVLIRSAGFALFFDSFHIGGPNAFYGGQAISDIAVFNREISIRLVDIRRQNLEAHLFALFFIKEQFFNIGNIQRHNGAHKFYREMRFQIGCLVRNQGIGRSMRLVKAVRGKFFHLVKNSAGNRFVNTVFNCAFHKHFALFGNFITHFFTHNLTQFISAAHGITAKRAGNVHDLFLVDHNAVGFF